MRQLSATPDAETIDLSDEAAAVFFDAEGMAGIDKNKYSPVVRIKLTDKGDGQGLAYLKFYERRWGGRIYKEKRQNRRCNQPWLWKLTKAQGIVTCLEALSPYLHIKKKAMGFCMERAKMMLVAPRHRIRPEESAKARELYLACQAANLRGNKSVDELDSG